MDFLARNSRTLLTRHAPEYDLPSRYEHTRQLLITLYCGILLRLSSTKRSWFHLSRAARLSMKLTESYSLKKFYTIYVSIRVVILI
jgi:hypothetical protein